MGFACIANTKDPVGPTPGQRRGGEEYGQGISYSKLAEFQAI